MAESISESGDFDDWKPPTEAELKVLNARRERQDKISKMMGEYLLQGYKMLGEVCAICQTILLRDKQGSDFCLACKELTSDTDKDNPALNEDAAASQAREGAVASTTEYSVDADSGLHYIDREPALVPPVQPMPNISSAANRLLSRLQQGPAGSDFEMGPPDSMPTFISPSDSRVKLLKDTATILESRLKLMNQKLNSSTQPEQIISCCDVIQKCLTTLQVIDKMCTTAS